jgi:ribosomal protein S18 acetylase RimI-like enzyme
MTKAHIAPTTSGDIPALQKVVEETGLFPSEMLPDLVASVLSGESSEVWLTCHANGEPCGLCYLRPEMLTEGTWNMIALAVSTSCQGEGQGSALVKGAEDHLRMNGARLLVVDTSGTEDFAKTREFYLKNGIRDFWDTADDKVTFRKRL